MKQDQQRYAMERISKAVDAKIAACKARHMKPGNQPTTQEKLRAIRDGDAALRRHALLSWKLDDAFDFSELTRPDALDVKPFEREAASIRERAAKIKDEIMLGDSQKAIKLIREFCK